MVRDKFYFDDEENEPVDLGDEEAENEGTEEEGEEDLGIEGEEEEEGERGEI